MDGEEGSPATVLWAALIGDEGGEGRSQEGMFGGFIGVGGREPLEGGAGDAGARMRMMMAAKACAGARGWQQWRRHACVERSVWMGLLSDGVRGAGGGGCTQGRSVQW